MFTNFRASGAFFQQKYSCYSIVLGPKNFSDDVVNGGKILLPPSTLGILANFNVVYPLLFQISNEKEKISTHCGVLEFIAEEGRVHLPKWMMNQLKIEDGDIIVVKNVAIPVGRFVKLQPQHERFLQISNPRAVLERTFRDFACLTLGDIITINYNSKTYDLKVMETKPGNAISIIEADLEVDFEAPPGYVEPSFKKEETEPVQEDEPMEDASTTFVPFSGGGQTIKGKTIPTSTSSSRSPSTASLNTLNKSPSPSPNRGPSPFGSIGKSPSPRQPVSFGSFSAPNAQPVALPAGKLVFGKVSTPDVTPSSSSSSLTSSLNPVKGGTIGRSQGQTLSPSSSSPSNFQAFSGTGHSLKGK